MKNEGVEINLNLGLLNNTTTNIELGLNATYNKNTVTGFLWYLIRLPLEFKLEEFQGNWKYTQIHTVSYPTFTYFFYEAT